MEGGRDGLWLKILTPSVKQAIFMGNLLPVTIGNTIAGALLVAMSYAIVFGTPGKKIGAFFAPK